jgi:drug/metabolite transporter (DMT)-like permease
MTTILHNKPSTLLLIIAFTIVFVVWGSTYFFIQVAVGGFPPMLMGALRYLTAGLLMLGWCYMKGDKLFTKKDMATSAISGLLSLFIATGVVMWVEKTLPSAVVAIMVSANPIWFVLLDRTNWKSNLRSKTTIGGVVLGFSGVLLLFGEAISKSFAVMEPAKVTALLLLVLSPIAWCAGTLVSKKRGYSSPARVNTSWQMLIAGVAFIPAVFINDEYSNFHFSEVPPRAWMALVYLILFGSIAAFTAYVWLMQVRPATQVSTHSYVNPVIAVLLGVCWGGELISGVQVAGLAVILFSVLLINADKYTFFWKTVPRHLKPA